MSRVCRRSTCRFIPVLVVALYGQVPERTIASDRARGDERGRASSRRAFGGVGGSRDEAIEIIVEPKRC